MKVADVDVDYAQLVKIYGGARRERRYSPAVCTGIKSDAVMGDPDPAHVSTSYVERSEPSDADGHASVHPADECLHESDRRPRHAVALYFMYYNWIRQHASLRVSPAMAAGLTSKLMNWEDVVALMGAQEAPKKRGLYKKRVA